VSLSACPRSERKTALAINVHQTPYSPWYGPSACNELRSEGQRLRSGFMVRIGERHGSACRRECTHFCGSTQRRSSSRQFTPPDTTRASSRVGRCELAIRKSPLVQLGAL